MPESALIEYVVTKTTTITETFGMAAANPAEARAAVQNGKANPIGSNQNEQISVQPRGQQGQQGAAQTVRMPGNQGMSAQAMPPQFRPGS